MNRDRRLLQYLDPLDCSKQVRGLGKRVGKDLKKEMGFTVLWIHCCLLSSYMSAHLWLCSLRVKIRPPLDTMMIQLLQYGVLQIQDYHLSRVIHSLLDSSEYRCESDKTH